MIKAEIVADSIAPSGVRLTTFVLTYPRFIHSEFMTHRVFSRNASSSRAIPLKRQLEMIKEDTASPRSFTANQRGMQGGENIKDQAEAYKIWNKARDTAIKYAQQLSDLGVHKQYVNRIIEPFSHITVVCTSTEFDNFFGLRHHYMAQPEIQLLAEKMYEKYRTNKPAYLREGDWHLPFVTEKDLVKVANAVNERVINGSEKMKSALRVVSVAKCARVSYQNHDKTDPTWEQDMTLYKRLLGAQPIHASPAEHQAMAVADANVRSGNFRGWIQFRKTLQGENIENFKPGMFEELPKGKQ